VYSVHRDSLFNLSKQGFRTNHFTDSLWLYRMSSLFNFLNIDKSIGFWDFIGKILDWREWAAESNYVLHEVPLPNLHKDYEWLKFFTEHHRTLHNDSRKDYNEGAFLCEASECYSVEVVFNFPSRNAPLDEHFAIFSNKLNMLIRNYHKPYMRMLEGIAYIRHVSNDLNHALFDFSCFNAEVFEIDEPCIFISSRQNYGHWFWDYLTKFYIIEKFEHLKDMPIIFGKLKAFQKESLEILGIDKRNIIELYPPDGKRCALYKFKKAFIPSDIPSGVGKSFLYKKFVKQRPPDHRKRRLYLSRKNDGDRRRVYNEEEVSLWLERLGFEIIIAEVLSIKETIELFSHAEMIVSSIGGQVSNMMFTDNCPLIFLVDSRLMETNDFNIGRLAFQNFFPMCDFIVPVVGTPVVENKNIIDDLCVFRIEDIERAVSEAENFLKKIR